MAGFIRHDPDDDYIVDDDSDIERDSRSDFTNVFVGVIQRASFYVSLTQRQVLLGIEPGSSGIQFLHFNEWPYELKGYIALYRSSECQTLRPTDTSPSAFGYFRPKTGQDLLLFAHVGIRLFYGRSDKFVLCFALQKGRGQLFW